MPRTSLLHKTPLHKPLGSCPASLPRQGPRGLATAPGRGQPAVKKVNTEKLARNGCRQRASLCTCEPAPHQKTRRRAGAKRPPPKGRTPTVGLTAAFQEAPCLSSRPLLTCRAPQRNQREPPARLTDTEGRREYSDPARRKGVQGNPYRGWF
jgi:hypothetical protein